MDNNNGEQLEKILFTLEKSETDQVRIRETTFKGKDYIDIRIYTKLQGTEDYVPTKKGVMLTREKMKLLREGLDKIEI
jgi:hypothetical protein